MARIAGINIPQNKLVHVGLTYIYGIGDKYSRQICAELNFPKEKKIGIPKYLETKNNYIWKLYDKSNVNEDRDQLKAVIGICLTFGSLFLMGLYSNLI